MNPALGKQAREANQQGIEPRDLILVLVRLVFIPGHVAKPGPYRYEEGLTVYQALLQAGGVTDRGSSIGVKIVRLVDGKPKEWKPQMTEALQPEDTIRVPERFF